MATKKKKAELPTIALAPDIGIVPGNQYVASIDTPKNEDDLIWFKVSPSSSGLAYSPRSQDGTTSVSFIVERAGDYRIWFEQSGKVIAEREFSV